MDPKAEARRLERERADADAAETARLAAQPHGLGRLFGRKRRSEVTGAG
jgi:hypothetical protein